MSKKNKLLLILSVPALLLIILAFTFSGEEESQFPVRNKVPYRIVEERDVSYINCQRVAVSVVVPNGADQRDVNYTLRLIADDLRLRWNDVTVFAYNESEEAQIGQIPYTRGKQESSICN